MKGIALAGTLLATAALADTPTYICTNANGSKAIQDRPCDAGQVLDRATSAKTNAPPPPKPFDPGAYTQKIHCNYREQLRDSAASRNANQTRAKDRAASNDRRRDHQDYLDKNCDP